MKPSDIVIAHGNLTIKVPSGLFRGKDGAIDREKAAPFVKMMKSRYPWLTDNSLEVVFRKASREYVRMLDDETGGRTVSADLESKGRTEEALAHLQKKVERNPNDPDSWYALGDLLCRMGRAKEGYEAYARGRKLF